MKLKPCTNFHIKNGKRKYIAPVSKLEWINLFHNRTDVSYEEIVSQIIKFREEFYECMAEKIDTPEFKKELMDSINAGINLLHAILIYYPDDTNYQSYNDHVNKINHRLLDPNYNWGIDTVIEGREQYKEKII